MYNIIIQTQNSEICSSTMYNVHPNENRKICGIRTNVSYARNLVRTNCVRKYDGEK